MASEIVGDSIGSSVGDNILFSAFNDFISSNSSLSVV